MKKIQKYRLGVQILCLVLTVIAFFANFKAAMLIIMGLTLLSGVFYCGWVCPYGFIQDLFSNIGRLLGIKKIKMPRAIQKVLVFSRYIIFGLVVLVGSDLIFSILSFYPRTNFGKLLLGNGVVIGAIGAMCFFALLALFFERPFCNYFCFEGGKYGLMSSLRIFTIKREDSKCVNCKKCDKACPMNIEVSKCSNLRSPQCINCFQCASNCPVKGTLSFGKANMTNREKKRYFTILAAVLVLIASFTVYNTYTGTNPLGGIKKHQAESTNEKNVTETLVGSVENLGDASGIADGVYIGEGEGFKGMMTVEVAVKNQQITSVEVVENSDDFKWFKRANNVIPDRIVDAQSTDVDLVSGATYSSMGIRDGVNDALEKAK